MSVRMASKVCKNCGREITWRKKWEKNWAAIAVCSASCRRPLGALDRAFEAGILEVLSQRRRESVNAHRKGGKETAWCTVEEVEEIIMARWRDNPPQLSAAEKLVEDAEAKDQQVEGEPSTDAQPASPSATTAASPRSEPAHVRERARKAARRLVDKKIVEIWQKGKGPVNPSFAKGTLELRGVAGLPVDLVAPPASPPRGSQGGN